MPAFSDLATFAPTSVEKPSLIDATNASLIVLLIAAVVARLMVDLLAYFVTVVTLTGWARVRDFGGHAAACLMWAVGSSHARSQ